MEGQNLPFAALSIEQASQLISDAIAKEIRKITLQNSQPEPDSLCVETAVLFLETQGLTTTPRNLYNWVFQKAIPYRKIGRKVVFSRKELLSWIESRTTRPEDSRKDAALRIAERANRKH